MLTPDKSRLLSTSDVSPGPVAANEPSMGEVMTDGSVGELLRIAREKAGLSLADIASRLRMGVKQVRALEDGAYDALPKGIFLRGFVRNFAKEVGVKPEQALGLLEKTHQGAGPIIASAVVIPTQQNISVPLPGGELATPRARALIAAVIALLSLTLFWWWWEYVRPYRAEGGRPKTVQAEEKSTSVPIEVPIQPMAAVAEQVNNAPPLSSNAPESKVSSPALVVQRIEASEVNAPPVTNTLPATAVVTRLALTTGGAMLGLTFTDKSWVEVVDATGKTVLDRTFKSGDAEEVTGRAPFSVVIGNAQATRMAYKGKEIDLAPYTRASVARLTIK